MVRFLIAVSGYNCARYVKACLDSIKAQTYQNYAVSIFDDCSIDGTRDAIIANRKIEWLCGTHTNNIGSAYARDLAIKNCTEPYDVIIFLDLDDRLMPNALEVITKAYEDPNVWLTYGNFIYNDGRTFFDASNINFTDQPFREQPWKFIPLRTFRRELYETLRVPDKFFPGATAYPDMHCLFSLLEKAKGHIKAIPEVIYFYNQNNPICVTYRFSQEQRDAEEKMIREWSQ